MFVPCNKSITHVSSDIKIFSGHFESSIKIQIPEFFNGVLRCVPFLFWTGIKKKMSNNNYL